MVRVAGLQDQVVSGASVRTPDGRTPQQTLVEIRERVLALTTAQTRLWRDEPSTRARRRGHPRSARRATRPTRSSPSSSASSLRQIFPVLTPLAVGPGQPFPYISGLSLSLGLLVRDPETGEERFARVKVPEGLDRFVAIGDPRAAHPARERDRALPRPPLPRDGDRRARRVPAHAGRRHRDLRRRRRPARSRRVRGAQAPVRLGRPRRGVELGHARRCSGASRSASASRSNRCTRSAACSTSPTSRSCTRSTGPT